MNVCRCRLVGSGNRLVGSGNDSSVLPHHLLSQSPWMDESYGCFEFQQEVGQTVFHLCIVWQSHCTVYTVHCTL